MGRISKVMAAAKKKAGIGKAITGKQRVARKKNIAVARKFKKKGVSSKVKSAQSKVDAYFSKAKKGGAGGGGKSSGVKKASAQKTAVKKTAVKKTAVKNPAEKVYGKKTSKREMDSMTFKKGGKNTQLTPAQKRAKTIKAKKRTAKKEADTKLIAKLYPKSKAAKALAIKAGAKKTAVKKVTKAAKAKGNTQATAKVKAKKISEKAKAKQAKAMSHEMKRFDTMTPKQLKTRLGRITKPTKLANFAKTAKKLGYKDLAKRAKEKLVWANYGA